MENTSAEEIVGRYWNEVWRDGRFDVVDEIFTDPFIRHSSAGTESTRRADYKGRLREFQRMLARPETTIDDFVVAGDRAWTRATSRGVNLETGEHTVVTWLMVQRIESGRIAEQWVAVQPNLDWERP